MRSEFMQAPSLKASHSTFYRARILASWKFDVSEDFDFCSRRFCWSESAHATTPATSFEVAPFILFTSSFALCRCLNNGSVNGLTVAVAAGSGATLEPKGKLKHPISVWGSQPGCKRIENVWTVLMIHASLHLIHHVSVHLRSEFDAESSASTYQRKMMHVDGMRSVACGGCHATVANRLIGIRHLCERRLSTP